MRKTGVEPTIEVFAGEEHRSFFLKGAGAAGALLVHGFGGTPAEVRPIAERLAAAGLTVRAPLLPGFGADLPSLHAFTYDDWLGYLRDEWMALRRAYEEVYLVGFSMGAALALQVAVDLPPTGLVLLAPLWRVLEPLWHVGALLPIAALVKPSLAPFRRSRRARDELARFLVQSGVEADLASAEAQQALRDVRVYLRTLESLWRAGERGGRVAPRVRVPTLVVQGRYDPLVRPAVTRRLVQRLGGSVSYAEVDAGHLVVSRDAPDFEDVAGRIVAFCGGAQGAEPPRPAR